MASPLGGPSAPVKPETASKQTAEPAPEAPGPRPVGLVAPSERTLEAFLFSEPFAFDFFQAVRVLERLEPARKPVGLTGPPWSEVVRFKAHISLTFPPSAIYDLARPESQKSEVRGQRSEAVPAMTVAFMGLTGPSGMLPRHYTEMLLRIEKEGKGPEKNALRDWIDLFNHRFISLFYRAWEKYRFFIAYERGDYARPEPDPYTLCLFSFVGLGMKPLRNRLRVSDWQQVEGEGREKLLAQVDDLALLYYSGFLSHRPRCAAALEALLADYFQLPAQILQFQGQWLSLDLANQSRMGEGDCNNQLGFNVVAGERVWDVQSKFRVRLGPLPFARFIEFLPDQAPLPQRKAFFLLCHLARLYSGPEYDFEVQPVLKAEDVPECQLTPLPSPLGGEGRGEGGIGPRLGWNTWIRSLPFPRDAEEAVFQGEDVVWVDDRPPARGGW